MSALKGLQDKIRHLELERTAAEDNLRTLANETSRFREILQPDDTVTPDPPRSPPRSPHASRRSPTRNLTFQNNGNYVKVLVVKNGYDSLSVL
jgi:hypothetical protein